MSSTDALREICQIDDRVLQYFGLGIFRGHGDALRVLRHSGVAESVRVVPQRASERRHVGPAILYRFLGQDG